MKPYNVELDNARILRELSAPDTYQPSPVNRKPAAKDIEKVFIRSAGDPSVGIRAQHYEAEIFLPRECFDEIEDIRAKFSALYEDIAGETVKVLFDFEMQSLIESEKAHDPEDGFGDHIDKGEEATRPPYNC